MLRKNSAPLVKCYVHHPEKEQTKIGLHKAMLSTGRLFGRITQKGPNKISADEQICSRILAEKGPNFLKISFPPLVLSNGGAESKRRIVNMIAACSGRPESKPWIVNMIVARSGGGEFKHRIVSTIAACDGAAESKPKITT